MKKILCVKLFLIIHFAVYSQEYFKINSKSVFDAIKKEFLIRNPSRCKSFDFKTLNNIGSNFRDKGREILFFDTFNKYIEQTNWQINDEIFLIMYTINGEIINDKCLIYNYTKKETICLIQEYGNVKLEDCKLKIPVNDIPLFFNQYSFKCISEPKTFLESYILRIKRDKIDVKFLYNKMVYLHFD